MRKKQIKYRNLLTFQNAKTSKGEKLNYLTGILYLAPADTIKGLNLCKFASKGCKSACLYSAGRGKFKSIQAARISKTELFRDKLGYFMECLINNIQKLKKRADKLGMIPVVRLNGTSDISWENIRNSLGQSIFDLFPEIQFYDYTKNFNRFKFNLPTNYHLTFSASESNGNATLKLIDKKVNIAVVFRSLPVKYLGVKVVSGDDTDLRFLDGKGVIVGLTAKGQAKKDCSGFVR